MPKGELEHAAEGERDEPVHLHDDASPLLRLLVEIGDEGVLVGKLTQRSPGATSTVRPALDGGDRRPHDDRRNVYGDLQPSSDAMIEPGRPFERTTP